MQYGWKPASRDASRRTRSVGQATFIDEKERERGYRFRLAGLTTAEGYDELEEINRLNGTKRDILVIRDRDSAELGRDTIWGLLENVVDYAQNEPLHFRCRFRGLGAALKRMLSGAISEFAISEMSDEGAPVLVPAAGVERFATHSITTGPSDDPPNTPIEGRILGSFALRREIANGPDGMLGGLIRTEIASEVVLDNSDRAA